MNMRKIIAMLLSVVLIVGIAAPTAMAATESAATVQLNKTQGTVDVTNGSAHKMQLMENMRLYNGYHVNTDEKSYAWVNLDSSKFAKLDAVSEMELRKNGKLLEVMLNAGSLFFNVTEPLAADETLNIRTSTMVAGIRGTCGIVQVIDTNTSKLFVLEGVVECYVSDPRTGQTKRAMVPAGQIATLIVYDPDREGDKCDIIMNQGQEEDVPGFALVELVGDTGMCEKIFRASGIDLRYLTMEDALKRLAADEASVAARMEVLRAALAEQKHHISKDPVWKEQPAYSDDSDDSDDSSSSSIKKPLLPQTLQEQLNDPAVDSVTVDEPLIVTPDEPLNVPAGKTLTTTNEVRVEPDAQLTVDGTFIAQNNGNDSFINDGTITVTSGQSMHIYTQFINNGEIYNIQNGLIEAVKGIENYGKITCDGNSNLTSTGANGTVYMMNDSAQLYLEGGVVSNTGTGPALNMDVVDYIENVHFSNQSHLRGQNNNVLVVAEQKIDISHFKVEGPDTNGFYNFQIILHDVTFEADGGTLTEETKKAIDGYGLGSVPTPVKGGYKFEGWYTSDGTVFDGNTVVNGAIKVTAKYRSIKIRFEANFVNGGSDDSTWPKEISFSDLKNGNNQMPGTDDAFKKFIDAIKYSLTGWNTDKAGTGDNIGIAFDGLESYCCGENPVTEDLRVYMQLKRKYTVLFDPGNNSSNPNDTSEIEYLEGETLGAHAPEDPTPADSGKIFAGWYDTQKNLWDEDTILTGDNNDRIILSASFVDAPVGGSLFGSTFSLGNMFILDEYGLMLDEEELERDDEIETDEETVIESEKDDDADDADSEYASANEETTVSGENNMQGDDSENTEDTEGAEAGEDTKAEAETENTENSGNVTNSDNAGNSEVVTDSETTENEKPETTLEDTEGNAEDDKKETESEQEKPAAAPEDKPVIGEDALMKEEKDVVPEEELAAAQEESEQEAVSKQDDSEP